MLQRTIALEATGSLLDGRHKIPVDLPGCSGAKLLTVMGCSRAVLGTHHPGNVIVCA